MPFNTPNVYTQEQSGLLPPSISNADTIPAFIGYTESGPLNTPTRITSLLEYEATFGGARNEEGLQVSVQDTEDGQSVTARGYSTLLYDSLYHSVQMFFANGGGVCYIVSTEVPQEIESKLTAGDPDTIEYFGRSVSLSGSRALIGTERDKENGVLTGAAYIFERQSDDSWLEVAKLTSDDVAIGDFFGTSVSLSGSTALISAPFDSDNGSGSGSAYIFERQSDDSWEQVAKLTADDAAAGDNFGLSVSLSGSTALIGAYHDDDNGDNSGSAYIFERQSDDSWLQVYKLTADDAAAGDFFGISVSLSGSRALIGADHDNDNAGSSGSAYIFERQSDDSWLQVAKLTASDAGVSDFFGNSVSLSGSTALVGAFLNNGKGIQSGSAYIFERQSDDSWLQVPKLIASDATAGDFFGRSVSLSGNRALIGAHNDDDNGNNSGSAYIFERQSDGSWSQVVKLTASDAAANDFFGRSVSLSGSTALIGANRDDDNANDSGSAYVYDKGLLLTNYQTALTALETEVEVSLLVFPNASNELFSDDLYTLYKAALTQAGSLKDRFVIMDTADDLSDAGDRFREGIGDSNLDYGAVYYPHVQTSLPFNYSDITTTINHVQSDGVTPSTYDGYSLATLQGENDLLYNQISLKLDGLGVTMPASAAMAGVYARIDHEKGVWKAPANTALSNVIGPVVKLSDAEQATFNVDEATGKSINVIRSFDGRGTLVWGGRTLDGNDHDWRYISTKRLLIQIERDLQTLTAAAIGNVNLSRNWTKLKGLIESYLMDLWQRGGLVGSSAEEAYFVGLGAGETMTTQDIINGDLNITVGVAATRPAEFVIITFTQQ